MSANSPSLDDRFAGCMLGLAVGDALGAGFEGQSFETMSRRYHNAATLFENPPHGELWYTDDTQMAISVAETLVACGRIDEAHLCKRFAENYVPQRGYGRGARVVLEAIAMGHDHKYLAANFLPGGSFGNGAAMRVAPVGLVFRNDHDRLWEEARLSALPTHVHPLGIEGAQLLALAVGLAATATSWNRDEFFDALLAREISLKFKGPLTRVARLTDVRDLGLFGNGIEATESVVTAIASFALAPESFVESVGNVILLGGDTDALAAMAGAISGAYLGQQGLPVHLVAKLEDRQQGRSYLEELAGKLCLLPGANA